MVFNKKLPVLLKNLYPRTGAVDANMPAILDDWNYLKVGKNPACAANISVKLGIDVCAKNLHKRLSTLIEA
jgi:hypothetical protein